MPNLPLVTIVTPSLNQGDFIPQTIASVLTQDYDLIEYFVIDGGSTDQTISYLQQMGSALQWVSEKDNGQSAAINKGWRMGKGEILAWLNSDDILLPGTVSRIVAVFQAHPDVMAVYGDCLYMNEGGRIVGRYPAESFNYQKLLLTATNFIPQPTLFFRRSVLAEIGALNEKLHYVMDYDLWLRIGIHSRFYYIPDTLAAMRLHSSAKSLRAVPAFGAELVTTLTEHFDSGRLPLPLQKHRHEALRNAWQYAAYCCFWSGQFREANRWLAKSWKQSNRILPSGSLLRLTFLNLFGKLGLKLAARFRGNPFLPNDKAEGEAIENLLPRLPTQNG